MGHERRQPPAEEGPSAPLWMVTFSDCMNLLLTFFILLVTFSSFDEITFAELRESFQKALPVLLENKKQKKDQTALMSTPRIMPTQSPTAGSEKPTLTSGTENNLEEKTKPSTFQDRKIFLILSDKIFYGKGMVISLQGQKILSSMASFLKEAPHRVVVSENMQGNEKDGEDIGLQRAWAVIEYFTTKQELDKRQFSISAAGTVAKFNAEENAANSEREASTIKAERLLEIVLLERSIYN